MNEKLNEKTTDAQTEQRPAAGAPATPAPPPYASAGEAFTTWLNRQVGMLPSPTLLLGTKRARVIKLLPDGRLQVEVETEALEPERQFVAFEGQHLDQLVRKIAAIGL